MYERCCNLFWKIKINEEDWGFGEVYCIGEYRIGWNLHVWLLYLPCETYFHTEWQNKSGEIEFSFKTNNVGEESKEFEQCGVRLVYKQDIEELNLTATHEPIELPMRSPRYFADGDDSEEVSDADDSEDEDEDEEVSDAEDLENEDDSEDDDDFFSCEDEFY